MDVSSQDPPLLALDLSKSYKPLTRGHAEAMDLAKKPEWYHRRPTASCGADIASAYRSRSSSSFTSLSAQPGAPVLCRDVDQSPDVALGNFMNSTLVPGLDLYCDGVQGNLWHPGFYGPDQSGAGGPVPESSGGEESDSGSDVIFLVSSAKEPLLCGPFLQDGVRPIIVAPLSPAASSPDAGRGCCSLPQPLSSPSPESSYSSDSSDSSADIPVHHARPVVLLSDLGAVYGNAAQSPVDISSDDSDVIEVSVSNERKSSRTFPCRKSPGRETPPQAAEIRRSSRIRKSLSDAPQFACCASRYSLRRQVKNDAVGIYNESCDSDDVMAFAVRSSSPDAEEPVPRPDATQRARCDSDESDAEVGRESESPPRNKSKTPLAARKTKQLRRTKQKQKQKQKQRNQKASSSRNKSAVARRKRKRQTHTGPSAPFSPREPEIKLKYAKLKEQKKKSTGGFLPFVHVERRTCTVVNDREDEAGVRSGLGGRRRHGAASLNGFVPRTSCFQPGRPGSESPGRVTLSCRLCGQTANATGLGDLHGPYYPTAGGHRSGAEHGPAKSQKTIDSSDGGRDARDRSPAGGDSHRKPPPHVDECWLHEDCGIWSAGVFLVRGKLYGLEEAARLAQETVCSACRQPGAIMGCVQKSCSRNFHYRCAVQSGCVLNEENFSMRCTEHKNKLLTSGGGARRRRR